MPSKRKGRKRTTSMSGSGLATTLIRDKIVPFDTPQSKKKFGELIAGAARPAQKTFAAPKEKGGASRPKVSAATLAREANRAGVLVDAAWDLPRRLARTSQGERYAMKATAPSASAAAVGLRGQSILRLSSRNQV